ncbi:TolC family protein [Marinithermus hydrothermalis]|uniref:Outer membrane efflux protein n=1 Tax=Marinithermus hydrothermalis (strain DSM 14884 / JCM 11576 / T1) TaxID=869210 RepID=F2NKR9_MARHT|nr:TolC family protein [Marinithermus hydrothermalis]AEB10832.1 hypothetical protein Marky_0069 [Marinithermus hydrothermalis DSM 14884]
MNMHRRHWSQQTLARALGMGSLLLWSAAFAFGPEEALEYRPPNLDLLEQQIRLLEGDLMETRLGLSGKLKASTNLNQDLAQSGLPPEYRLDLEAGWELDPIRLSRAERDLARAQRTWRTALREGIAAALEAHANLWRTQTELERARVRLEEARLRLAELERREGTPELNLRAARLEVKITELEVAQAEQALADARAAAERLGLTGPAEARVLRFELPADAPAPPGVVEAKHRLKEAEAGLLKARLGLAPNPRLGVGVALEDAVELGASAQIRDGRPSLGVGVTLRDPEHRPDATGWSVSLSLEIPLSRGAYLAPERAAVGVELARIELERTQEATARALEQARAGAELAWRGLELALENLEITRLSVAEAQTRFEGGTLAERDFLRAKRSLAERERDVARAWQTYLRRVKDVLKLADAEWRVAERLP